MMKLAIACVFGGGVLAGCSALTPALTPPQTIQNETVAQPIAARTTYAAWGKSLVQIPLPGAGCYKASYPSTTWSRIACATSRHLLRPSLDEVAANAVPHFKQAADYTAHVQPHLISAAIGSFPAVKGVKRVTSTHAGLWSGLNSYGLQLNSQDFRTAGCGNVAHCEGWVQFVYQNPSEQRVGNLTIWDWLVSTTSKSLSGCPPNAGWQFFSGFCYQTSSKQIDDIPNQPITELGEMILTGNAASTGDSITLAVGSTVYAVKKAQGDGITDLSTHWQGAEFNVFAPGSSGSGYGIATFNAGSTITVGLELNDGATTAPNCEANSGTTAETNSLAFVSAPQNPPAREHPSILFTESNARGGGSPSCDALAGS